MSKKYLYGIFIFRKDLRIIDNRGLIKLFDICKEIIPIFIFDPYQVDLNSKTKNYLSFPALRFICESVKDLNKSIQSIQSQLNVFYGNPMKVIEHLIKQLGLDENNIALGFNLDFTEYSIKRDNEIINFCKKHNIYNIICDDDNTLCDMNLLLKEQNIPYKQYGAFKKNMLLNKSKFNEINSTKIKFAKLKKKFQKRLQKMKLMKCGKIILIKIIYHLKLVKEN